MHMAHRIGGGWTVGCDNLAVPGIFWALLSVIGQLDSLRPGVARARIVGALMFALLPAAAMVIRNRVTNLFLASDGL
jgi:hypothetical protein